MKKIMITRLLESFSELDRAIATAKKTLEQKQRTPKAVLERIASYEQMLVKQKSLALSLSRFADAGDWVEVTRHIRLINGLSEMIRDDARQIVSGLKQVVVYEERPALLT